MPVRSHLHHQPSKISTAPLHYVGRELVSARGEAPVDVVASIVELQAGPDLDQLRVRITDTVLDLARAIPLELHHMQDADVALPCLHHGNALEHPRRHKCSRLLGDWQLSSDRDDAGIFLTCLRQVLLPDPGAGTVGADQQVAGRTRAVAKAGSDSAVTVLVEAGELFAEGN